MDNEKNYVKRLKSRMNNYPYADRLCFSIEWYITYAKINKFFYYTLNIMAIVIPFVSSILAVQIIKPLAWLSATSSICIALLEFFKCKQRWQLYRSTAELLKSRAEIFLINSSDINSSGYDKFVKDCEYIISEENKKWEQIFEKKHPRNNELETQ